jgi:hypothetical protein
VIENSVLRKIFGPKRIGSNKRTEKLCNEKYHNIMLGNEIEDEMG